MSLTSIGKKFGTDKSHNGMLDYYERKLSHLRDRPINILEVGVFHGASIKMWREFFPLATIYGVDTFKGKQGNGHTFDNARDFYNDVVIQHKYDRIHLIECDQSDRKNLEMVRDEFKLKNIVLDVIIDDGSHLMKDQQQTFGILSQCLASHGMYFMEDWGSSLDRYPDVKADLSNSTLTMMLLFNRTNQILSDYLTPAEKIYIESRLNHPIDIWHVSNSGTALLTFKP